MLEFLILALVIVLLMVVFNSMWSAAGRAEIGYRPGQEILSIDDSSEHPGRNIFSRLLPLCGRPDRIIRAGNTVIPVEEKPIQRRLRERHVIQAYAYCQLIEETYRKAPPFAVVRLKGGKEKKVYWNEQTKAILKNAVTRAYDVLYRGKAPRHADDTRKCDKCGYRNACA